jgi:hypothetical protein
VAAEGETVAVKVKLVLIVGEAVDDVRVVVVAVFDDELTVMLNALDVLVA